MHRDVIKLSLAFCSVALLFTGCQSGLTGLPSLSTLNSPTRIPPPATGSYAAPQGYGTPGVSGPTSSTNLKPVGATLAQLRSLESGKDVGDVFGSEGRVASNGVQENKVTARPVVAPPITPIQALIGTPEQSIKAAAASMASSNESNSALPNSSGKPVPVIMAAATNPTLSSSVNLNELPDPRDAIQDSYTQISNGIAWKNVQR